MEAGNPGLRPNTLMVQSGREPPSGNKNQLASRLEPNMNIDLWPQRETFAFRLKAYQKSTGKTQQQVADDQGVVANEVVQP